MKQIKPINPEPIAKAKENTTLEANIWAGRCFMMICVASVDITGFITLNCTDLHFLVSYWMEPILAKPLKT